MCLFLQVPAPEAELCCCHPCFTGGDLRCKRATWVDSLAQMAWSWMVNMISTFHCSALPPSCGLPPLWQGCVSRVRSGMWIAVDCSSEWPSRPVSIGSYLITPAVIWELPHIQFSCLYRKSKLLKELVGERDGTGSWGSSSHIWLDSACVCESIHNKIFLLANARISLAVCRKIMAKVVVVV